MLKYINQKVENISIANLQENLKFLCSIDLVVVKQAELFDLFNWLMMMIGLNKPLDLDFPTFNDSPLIFSI